MFFTSFLFSGSVVQREALARVLFPLLQGGFLLLSSDVDLTFARISLEVSVSFLQAQMKTLFSFMSFKAPGTVSFATRLLPSSHLRC